MGVVEAERAWEARLRARGGLVLRLRQTRLQQGWAMGVIDAEGAWGAGSRVRGGWDVVYAFERGWGGGFVDEIAEGVGDGPR